MKLVNWHWVIAGILTATLLAVSQVYTSWQRVSPDWQREISFIAYSANVLFSYLVWVVLAVLINWLRLKIPPFTHKQKSWFGWHAGLSCVIGIGHLFLDSILLCAVFGFEIDFLSTFTEKLLRWLPYEILAYWACLGLLQALSGRFGQQIDSSSETKAFVNKIPVKFQEQSLLLDIDDIESVEAYDNYVFIYTTAQRYLLKRTMLQMACDLDAKKFVRVHRSTLVNLYKVIAFSTLPNGQLSLTLESGKNVVVSRRNKRDINARLKHSLYQPGQRSRIDIKSADLGDSSFQPLR